MESQEDRFQLIESVSAVDRSSGMASGTAESLAPQVLGKLDPFQLVFWISLLVAAASAAVAIAWPRAVGTSGPVLLIAMGSTGMVFLLWMLRGAGQRLGLFPEREAAARAVLPSGPRFAWIDALDEAVLVTDRAGTPIVSNSAYRDLAIMARVDDAKPDGTLSVDEVFAASPGVSAPVYRLSKAARSGQTQRETLPPVAMGLDGIPAQYEVAVAPLPKGRVLWRLRRLAGNQDMTGDADLRALYVEDAPMGFLAVRPDGTLMYANHWVRDHLGLSHPVQSVRIDDIMRPEFVKRLTRDRKARASSTCDIQLRSRDGIEIPVQATSSWAGKGVNAHGRILLQPVQDKITAQPASATLTNADHQQAGIEADPMFDDAPFGAVRLTGETVEGAIIVDANPALMELTKGRAVPGTRFADLFAAQSGIDALNDGLTDAIDKLVGLELAGDETRSVSLFVSLDSQGRPAVAYIIDMTEQKALEMRLAQGEKMQAIGQLAGGVAHDFNNVLTGIMLNTDTLTTRHPVGDPSYENLKNIHEFSVRARDLVRMLLAYARQQTFKSDVLNVTDFLSEFSLLLRQIIDERVELDIRHGRDVPHIKADKNQLETAIINLATNARDAMLAKANGGKLTIRTDRAAAEDAHKAGFGFVEEGDYLLIEVSDNGHGIPASVIDKIFQPFFTTKAVGVGTGLGLSTVYGIIKQSGGYICPTSTVGEGTSFHIYLPALAADEVPVETPEETVQTVVARPVDMSGRGRILLVEDEPGVRAMAAKLLENRGYDVEQACDGEEALEILEAESGAFDLVISDVVMPGMDGPTLIKEAAAHLGDARIIFISGYAERDIAKQLDENREVSFLPKPFNVAKLAERVKLELSRRAEAADKMVA
ncbi:MAG: response regulator [Pseudomonadota bacterium]